MPPFLLALFGSKTAIITTLCVLLFVTCGGYYYYANKRIQILKDNQEKLELAIQTQTDVIKKMESDMKSVKLERNKYVSKITELTDHTRKLEQQIQQKPLDLKKNPKLAEDRINATMRNVLRCLEITTGSGVTKNEKNIDCSSIIS